MRLIIALVCLLALAVWGGKTMFEATNRKVEEVNIASTPNEGTQDLMSLLPSGEGTKDTDIPAIAPAAGESQ